MWQEHPWTRQMDGIFAVSLVQNGGVEMLANHGENRENTGMTKDRSMAWVGKRTMTDAIRQEVADLWISRTDVKTIFHRAKKHNNPEAGVVQDVAPQKAVVLRALRIRKEQDAAVPSLAKRRPAASVIVYDSIKTRMDEALEREGNGLTPEEDAPDILARTWLSQVTEEQLKDIGFGFLSHRRRWPTIRAISLILRPLGFPNGRSYQFAIKMQKSDQNWSPKNTRKIAGVCQRGKINVVATCTAVRKNSEEMSDGWDEVGVRKMWIVDMVKPIRKGCRGDMPSFALRTLKRMKSKNGMGFRKRPKWMMMTTNSKYPQRSRGNNVNRNISDLRRQTVKATRHMERISCPTDVERISHCAEDEPIWRKEKVGRLHESLECDAGEGRVVAGRQREGECWEFVPRWICRWSYDALVRQIRRWENPEVILARVSNARR
ncbi:hypothetical protein B0H11DRAFT_2355825 [Mycena galericulata]|nr:hypothetical protein B0H11DRAFT_2355825 [Mycena galericulata]